MHVGIQLGREPHDLVPGDSDAAAWTTEIGVTERDGGVDFRGPGVQGRPGGRFVYLTWGNVASDGAFTMFRRAKLMLTDLEPLLTAADLGRRIVADVDLTDDCGGPRCARGPGQRFSHTAGAGSDHV